MDAILGFLAAAAAKATAILVLAGIVTSAWRSASASTKHLVWTTGIVAALVLPIAGLGFAMIGGPRIPISLWTPVATVLVDVAPPVVHEPSEVVALPPVEMQPGTVKEITSSSIVMTPDEPVAVALPETARIGLPDVGAILASSMAGSLFDSWSSALLVVWAAGAMLALLPLFVALVRVRIVSQRARPTSDLRWVRLIRETPGISHLAPRVRVIESDEASMPMTWGVRRPTLLVPANASAWPEWKCRNVLLHELAHVERRDCLTQIVAQLACAVYWFNPLAWVAVHRMRVERELACDDRVISAGSAATEYAEILLEVARSLRAPSFTSQTAIAMARPSQLSGRLLAVLDGRRNRKGVSRPVFAGASLAALMAVLVLASVTTTASVATAAEAPSMNAASPVSGESVVALPGQSTLEYLPSPLAVVTATQVIAAQGSATCWTDRKFDGNSQVSVNDNGDGSKASWTVKLSRDGCLLELRAEGEFKLRADLSDVESLSRGGWFRLEERDGGTSRRMEIRNAGNGIEHTYYVNGDRVSLDASGRAWLARTLLEVERRTAFAADTRVPGLYQSGGVSAVVAEIAQMSSAYAKSKYYGTLFEMPNVRLDTNTLNDIVRRASVDLKSSDYYMTQVLGKLAGYPSANEATWRAFAEAAGRMESDYYKSQMLKKVLVRDNLSRETVGVLLTSASGIDSDHYLTDVLKSVAKNYALNDETRAVYARALGSIESDYYRSELLRSMNSAEEWDPRTTAFVLSSVSDIKSDYYKSQSLTSLVNARHIRGWPAFFKAVESMSSDVHKREILNAALKHDPLTREMVAGVLTAAGRMGSDYETTQVLSSVARTYKMDKELREQYEKVTDSIGSDYYRGSALSALRKSASR